MAIAACSGWTLYGRAYVFERDGTTRALAFPVMPFPGRVNASEMAGVLAWNPYAKTLTALEGNDVCEGTVTRHTLSLRRASRRRRPQRLRLGEGRARQARLQRRQRELAGDVGELISPRSHLSSGTL
jgi:hypothetical protein